MMLPSQQTSIMVIDDDPDIRDLIEQVLSDEGYHVMPFGDGKYAAALARKQTPALVLLDLMMPIVSGWDVLQLLRQQAETAHVPVVLISASRDLDSACTLLQANGSLPKPFDLDVLIDTVRTHIGAT